MKHDVAASAPNNYRYFMTPGTTHCIFEEDGVYHIDANGVRLINWLGNNIDVENIDVQGSGALRSKRDLDL